MYSKYFSKIYNEFGWNFYPEAFAEQLLLWISRKMPHAKNILDLGCGTGVLCRILRKHGFSADGADLSENMINIAKREDPEGHYEVADMTIFQPRRCYDIVTCTGDAINHLTDIKDVEKTFKQVFSYLEKGGCFIFDLLSDSEISDPEPIEFDYDEKTSAALQMTRTHDGIVTLQILIKENGEITLKETITERLYDIEEIRGLLEKTGFANVTCSHRLLDDGPAVPTWYVTGWSEDICISAGFDARPY